MRTIRLIALVWLIGGIYILIASGFKPGLFGVVTTLFGIPAGIGLLLNKRWAIWPATLLCSFWGILACIFLLSRDGLTLTNISLFVAAIGCGSSVYEWYRSRGRPGVVIMTI